MTERERRGRIISEKRIKRGDIVQEKESESKKAHERNSYKEEELQREAAYSRTNDPSIVCLSSSP